MVNIMDADAFNHLLRVEFETPGHGEGWGYAQENYIRWQMGHDVSQAVGDFDTYRLTHTFVAALLSFMDFGFHAILEDCHLGGSGGAYVVYGEGGWNRYVVEEPTGEIVFLAAAARWEESILKAHEEGFSVWGRGRIQ